MGRVDRSEALLAAARLEAEFRALGTPERAAAEKVYLKSALTFLGCTVWQIRAAIRAWLVDHPLESGADALVLAEALWSEPIHERRMAAVVVLGREVRNLSVADISFLERLLRESLTWALVDGLSTNVVGEIRRRDPDGARPILDRWSEDGDFWIRRASLLGELPAVVRDLAPLEPFLTRADAMLEEKEFFVRKAIGWVLREVGKKRPAEVVAWLEPRTARASGVTMREAVRWLPEADRERLMTAYREQRGARNSA
jgi:3-methyladenine DNA glycosylase AlkD